MTDDRFERDVRAVLHEMAPASVPIALRTSIVEIPIGAQRVRLRRGPTLWRSLTSAVAATAVLVVAGLVVVAVMPRGEPGGAIPTPRSSVVDHFIEQIDGLSGYRMLRPANWMPFGGGVSGRSYLAPGSQGAQQNVNLTATNLKLVGTVSDPNGVDAQWLLFQRNSTLAGWTAGIEGMWTRDGSAFTLLRTLPNAKIYSLSVPGGSKIVVLVAYVIDQGQPLVLELQATGPYADLGQLQTQGIVDDFATMAGSMTAIPEDGTNVHPSLPSPAPEQPGPAIP